MAFVYWTFQYWFEIYKWKWKGDFSFSFFQYLSNYKYGIYYPSNWSKSKVSFVYFCLGSYSLAPWNFIRNREGCLLHSSFFNRLTCSGKEHVYYWPLTYFIPDILWRNINIKTPGSDFIIMQERKTFQWAKMHFFSFNLLSFSLLVKSLKSLVNIFQRDEIHNFLLPDFKLPPKVICVANRVWFFSCYFIQGR